MMCRLRQNPVQIALGALLVYLLTLSHSVTLSGLALTGKVAGWDWQPLVGLPVYTLLTLPLRLLPGAWVPLSLNVLSAVLAAITLGLLSRILELMPWPRPLNRLPGWQRLLVNALAVSVCGLEFNFWQNATSASSEMLDAVLLATPVWCLMEFRARILRTNVVDERWLRTAAGVWGLGMAQNWMMVFTLPLFLVALVVLHPLGMVRGRQLVRLAGWGLLGFSVYAAAPLVNAFWPGSPWSFEASWLTSLKQTVHLLTGTVMEFVLGNKAKGLVVLIFYLVPGLALLAMIHDEDMTNKSPLAQWEIWMFRNLRAALLLLCLWLALDPTVGPQGILSGQLKHPMPLLSFDFFNGLGAGFLTGTLLLMTRKEKSDYEAIQFDPLPIRVLNWLERATLPAVAMLILLSAGVLVSRNLPAILEANRQPLTRFGELAVDSLPPGQGIMLADSPIKLRVFQAAQARHADASGRLAVDVSVLSTPEYRTWLNRKSPGLWLVSAGNGTLAPMGVMQVMDGLVRAKPERVFYLHPSFSFLFEGFYLEPAGSVYGVRPFLNNAVNPPPLPEDLIARNEKIWDEFMPRLEPLVKTSEKKKSSAEKFVEKNLFLGPIGTIQDRMLAEWYSMALDAWGVDLQRANRLPQAKARFEQALALFPDNWIARLNLNCNSNLQHAAKMDLGGLSPVLRQLGDMKNIADCLSGYGPVDDPALCFLLGNVYAQSSEPRRAMQQLQRAAALAPDVLAPQFALAKLYLHCRLPEEARKSIDGLRAATQRNPQAEQIGVEISFLEAELSLMQTNPVETSRILADLAQENADNTATVDRVLQALIKMRDYPNAQTVIEEQLARHPDNVALLLTRSGLYVQAGQPGRAIPVLNRILKLTNSPPARLDRAIAELQVSNYPAAQADFLALTNSRLNPFTIRFGLAEAALGQRDTNLAVSYFTECLSNAPAGSPPWKTALDRLNALQK